VNTRDLGGGRFAHRRVGASNKKDVNRKGGKKRSVDWRGEHPESEEVGEGAIEADFGRGSRRDEAQLVVIEIERKKMCNQRKYDGLVEEKIGDNAAYGGCQS